MRESTLQKRILDKLNSRCGCKAINYHGSVYGQKGTPDIVGAYKGRMLLIEVKTGAHDVDPLQEHRIKQWRNAGAVAVVAREDFDVEEFLEKCF